MITPRFQELQKFNQWWLWLILIAFLILAFYGLVSQLILNKPFGSKPMSNSGLIVFSLGVAAFIYFFYALKLITKIDAHQIYFRFVPFLKKTIEWRDVKSAKVVNYGFVGYGIRFGSKYGVVYNVNGKMGLALELKSGKKLVIGTQKEQELKSWLKSYDEIRNGLNSSPSD